MHLFVVGQRVYDPLFGKFFEPGVEYLIESQNVPPREQVMHSFRYPVVRLEPVRWEDYGFKTVPSFKQNEKVVVIRAGGYGDLFYLMPVMAALSRKLSGDKERLLLVTAMKPFPTKVPLTFVPFPCSIADLPKGAALLNMEDLPGELEKDFSGSTTARYARRAGLDEDELIWDANELFPIDDLKRRGEELWQSWHGSKRPRIFVALTASAATRSFPHAIHLSTFFANNAALFVATKTPFVTPFPCGELPSPEDFMAAVVAADGVVGVDTAPTHLSILLKKPTLAVFGAIPSHLRIPEHLHDASHITVLNVTENDLCPCRLNKPECPVTRQPVCFALAALQAQLFMTMKEFIVNLT